MLSVVTVLAMLIARLLMHPALLVLLRALRPRQELNAPQISPRAPWPSFALHQQWSVVLIPRARLPPVTALLLLLIQPM